MKTKTIVNSVAMVLSTPLQWYCQLKSFVVHSKPIFSCLKEIMTDLNQIIYWVLGAAALAIVYAVVLIAWILRQKTGTPKMVEIASAIQEGAAAYLKRQY